MDERELDKIKVGTLRQIQILNENRGINYGFSPYDFGNMSYLYAGGDVEKVIKNRLRFSAALEFDLNSIVAMDPVHHAQVSVVDERHCGSGAYPSNPPIPSTDALITTRPGVSLVLNPADCAPIIITNRKADFIAMVHAGREGTNLQISSIVVSQIMKLGFNHLEDFVVGIGPTIGCYEQQYIQTHNPDIWEPYVGVKLESDNNNKVVTRRINSVEPPLYHIHSENPQRKLFVDLVGANISQLVGAGIPKENIEALYFCTKCNAEEGRIFSHVTSVRHRGLPDEIKFPEGRFMAVAQINN